MFTGENTNLFSSNSTTFVKDSSSQFVAPINIIPDRYNSVSEPVEFPQALIGKENKNIPFNSESTIPDTTTKEK